MDGFARSARYPARSSCTTTGDSTKTSRSEMRCTITLYAIDFPPRKPDSWKREQNLHNLPNPAPRRGRLCMGPTGCERLFICGKPCNSLPITAFATCLRCPLMASMGVAGGIRRRTAMVSVARLPCIAWISHRADVRRTIEGGEFLSARIIGDHFFACLYSIVYAPLVTMRWHTSAMYLRKLL